MRMLAFCLVFGMASTLVMAQPPEPTPRPGPRPGGPPRGVPNGPPAKPAPSSALSSRLRILSVGTVVVGKITSIEDKGFEVEASPLAEGGTYKIAVVKVESVVLGEKTLKEVRVGFLPAAETTEEEPEGERRRPARRGGESPRVAIAEGWEGMLFLMKSRNGETFQIPAPTPPLSVKDSQYAEDSKIITRIADILNDPIKSLSADKPEERQTAALVLLSKYKSTPLSYEKLATVEVSAEETKKIFEGLIAGDWSEPDPIVGQPAQSVFFDLKLGAEEKYTAPMYENDTTVYVANLKASIKAWHTGAGSKYLLKRKVPQSK